MSQSNNVVMFPGVKRVTKPKPTNNEDIIAEVFSNLVDSIVETKPPIDISKLEYELALFLESIRSLLDKMDGKDHTLQSRAKDMFIKTGNLKPKITLRNYEPAANTN